jgi:DNA-binding CsgD family transcriptional regulator
MVSLEKSKLLSENEITNMEIEVFKYLIKGYSKKKITKVLGVSSNTLNTHRWHINSKLG